MTTTPTSLDPWLDTATRGLMIGANTMWSAVAERSADAALALIRRTTGKCF